MWHAGDDPNVSSSVYGSGVDDANSQYRYRPAGGTYTAWATSSDESFKLTNVVGGDVVDVQVQEYDRAGNASTVATTTLTIPSGPPAESSQLQVPVIACIEWCPAVAAGVYAGAEYFWHVHSQYFDWSQESSWDAIHVTRSNDDSQSFADAEATWKKQRDSLRSKGIRAEPEHADGSHEAHHVVAVTAQAARYSRWIFYKCGLDPNNWDDNGLWLPKQFHKRMHTKDYYAAIDRMLKKYDPTFGDDPCGTKEDPTYLNGNGLRQVMKDIKAYILRGEMP